MCIFLYLWKYIFELNLYYFFISSQLDIGSTNSLGIVQVDQQPTYTVVYPTSFRNGESKSKWNFPNFSLFNSQISQNYDLRTVPKICIFQILMKQLSILAQRGIQSLKHVSPDIF